MTHLLIQVAMDDIESRVNLYREMITTCLTSDGVLSRLPDVIPQGEQALNP